MRRPIVGIISNAYLINDQYPAHANGQMNTDAVATVSDCLPLTFPADPAVSPLEELLDTFDGFLLTGGRPNVHPEEYGEEPTEAHGAFDRNRDRVALPLTRACIERGQPILGICRGFQEMAVAMGSTLHPEIRDLPGRMNHRMPPDGTLEEKFALRHEVRFTSGGPFARMMGAEVVMTNTLHGQGIKQAGPRVIVDGWAPDETPEAIHFDGAQGFALAVQWHPEANAAQDPVSRPLFEAFGEACRAWRAGKRPASLAAE
ncbi:gamma-glutamyl-gamma-aminobutyrate hydrolase family protein [Jannaschia aquimarina]|uniref:gamma-glutamyl-gamma-aminobutyrate hydrolase n=1 Tax=Jannaschia aquimarina TaxID=935700 RepID=A0A0D1CQT0_9RHOB|nr:gamma-glutamyl-gamma-aminobutyrate hydrolase family protein [Jannaschia aquimarina]KIT17132.1 Gamma-glutamyl-gamma-aminobutyrate hydrolase PuuD [Jannaschia aquimarina]SNT30103.1 putative glutamine amidotransferase [Jannaschia aquimarina]